MKIIPEICPGFKNFNIKADHIFGNVLLYKFYKRFKYARKKSEENFINFQKNFIVTPTQPKDTYQILIKSSFCLKRDMNFNESVCCSYFKQKSLRK
jgi:hypothetical protein